MESGAKTREVEPNRLILLPERFVGYGIVNVEKGFHYLTVP